MMAKRKCKYCKKLEPENFLSHTVWILIYVKGYVSNCVYLIRQLTLADTKNFEKEAGKHKETRCSHIDKYI